MSRHRLPVKEQVILTLELLRNNLSQTFLADLLDISQSTASRIYRRMLPVINEALTFTGISLEEAASDGRVILIDGTYVPTGNRPAQGRDLTKVNYSGKRRCQCLSIQVASTLEGQLLAISTPVPGARHDSAALDLTGWSQILAENHTPWIADTAYIAQGALTPLKKKKGHERTDHEKRYNKEISSIRSHVEHAIGHLKQWTILATGYRGRLTELPDIIAVITRLELYRLGW
ncbi:transposase family protein [Austwickia sp. TVS 96-490-7B]|uniref:transposase family protein n=1 Tax=Austwickia sp. TVS 96-490-7B TaxID=2830843 RepID=UPI001C57D33C|nr:transposase family protein [Austwickia sp. TVS 96-490-7B]